MTYHPELPFEPQDEAERLKNLAYLITRLQVMTSAHSEDYADEIDDAYRLSRGSSDFGGTLESDISFEARRTRGVVTLMDDDESVGSSIETYTITSILRRTELRYETFPSALQELVIKRVFKDEDDNEDTSDDHDDSEATTEDIKVQDIVSDFGIGYWQRYHVHSGGHFSFDYSLMLYMDDDEVEIDADTLSQALTEIERDNSKILPKEDEFFASIFSSEELFALDNTAADAEFDCDAKVTLEMFALNMAGVQFTPPTRQYVMAQQIAELAFATES